MAVNSSGWRPPALTSQRSYTSPQERLAYEDYESSRSHYTAPIVDVDSVTDWRPQTRHSPRSTNRYQPSEVNSRHVPSSTTGRHIFASECQPDFQAPPRSFPEANPPSQAQFSSLDLEKVPPSQDPQLKASRSLSSSNNRPHRNETPYTQSSQSFGYYGDHIMPSHHSPAPRSSLATDSNTHITTTSYQDTTTTATYQDATTHLQACTHQKPRSFHAPVVATSTPQGAAAAAEHRNMHLQHIAMANQGRSQSDRVLRVPNNARPPLQSSLSEANISSPHSPSPSPAAMAASSEPSSSVSRPRYNRGRHSEATLENERYLLDGICRPDHPNEDRHFVMVRPDYTVLGVFDGHDGPRAVGFASNYMHQLFETPSWGSIVSKADPTIVREALGEFFKATEKDFFYSIRRYIEEKESLQSIIPQHLSSYAAFQQFPYEVSQLQELEPKLSGGCTAVLAVVVQDRLYVANAGDSRALLVRQQPDETLTLQQLSVDHSVENEEELKRLEALGLDPRVLIQSGRLGMHENTRSIGDYSIKKGYKDTDTLRTARSAPGIATPYIMPAVTIDHTCKFLILMTDGVYKSIESPFDDQKSIDPNKVFVNMMDHSLTRAKGELDQLSDTLLARITKIHRDCYEKNAKIDPKSPLAVNCRKRDDMTLQIYQFPDSK